jgi:hypothetical protein
VPTGNPGTKIAPCYHYLDRLLGRSTGGAVLIWALFLSLLLKGAEFDFRAGILWVFVLGLGALGIHALTFRAYIAFNKEGNCIDYVRKSIFSRYEKRLDQGFYTSLEDKWPHTRSLDFLAIGPFSWTNPGLCVPLYTVGTRLADSGEAESFFRNLKTSEMVLGRFTKMEEAEDFGRKLENFGADTPLHMVSEPGFGYYFGVGFEYFILVVHLLFLIFTYGFIGLTLVPELLSGS